MSQVNQLLFIICLLIIVYVFTRKIHAWRIGRAYKVIIRDLRNRGAFDPSSAVRLPYAKQVMFRIGAKDYRPKALEYLVTSRIVGITEEGECYLAKKDVEPLEL